LHTTLGKGWTKQIFIKPLDTNIFVQQVILVF